MVGRGARAHNLVAVVGAQPSAMAITQTDGTQSWPLCDASDGDGVPAEAQRGLLRVAREAQRILEASHIAQYVAPAEGVSRDSQPPPPAHCPSDRKANVDDRSIAELLQRADDRRAARVYGIRRDRLPGAIEQRRRRQSDTPARTHRDGTEEQREARHRCREFVATVAEFSKLRRGLKEN